MASFAGQEKDIGTLLKSARSLSVPTYQREYSWTTTSEVSDLWDDLTESLEHRLEYFIGIIVLVRKQQENEYDIIDGQQRIVTILLLLAAIREKVKASQSESAKYIQDSYFGTPAFLAEQWISKFQTNLVDEEVFRNYVFRSRTREEVEVAETRAAVPSHRLLLRAYLFFLDELETRLRRYQTDHDRVALLARIVQHLETRIKVMEMVVEDESVAFTIFETLNGRGLALSAMDLVKNRLLGKSGDSRREYVKRVWDEIVHNLNNIEGGSSTEAKGKFLRHHWVAQHGRIHLKDLYRAMKTRISDAGSSVSFVESLKTSSRFYAAIHNPSHPVWAEFPNQAAARSIRAINILDSLQSYPIMLAALHRLEEGRTDQATVSAVFRLLVVMAMRYSLIGQRRTGTIDLKYADVADKFYNGSLNTSEQVLQHISPLCPTDEEFLADFLGRELKESQKVRYVLSEIEAYLSNAEVDVNADASVMTVEHVIPQSPSDQWRDYAQRKGYAEEIDRWIYRIGNLTLIQRIPNQHFSNSALFHQKRDETYRSSRLLITTMLGEYQEWTPVEIQHRTQKLGQLAVSVWRLGG